MNTTPLPWSECQAPGLNDIEALARAALDALPDGFRSRLGEVRFTVAEFPTDEVVDDLGAESPFEIMGLFQGVGMAHDSATPATGTLPNQIWLYRRPILDYWAESEDSLGAIVTHVLIHEIGHHFGLSDDDMETLEAQAD